MNKWNIDTFSEVKTHIALGRTVKVILHENIASFGRLSIENAPRITNIRLAKNPRELEIEIDNRGTFIPITDQDIILMGN